MTGFSWAQAKSDAILFRQRRYRTLAKCAGKEMKLKHPDWCRDASQGNYTVMNKKIKDEMVKKQLRQETFDRKLHQDG